MPYKHITKHIPRSKDRRVKLSLSDKRDILANYPLFSQRQLAEIYQVSRRLIQFILNPEAKEQNYQRRIEKGGSAQYYDKDKRREYMKNHRRYKQQLYLQGDLI